MQKKDYVPKILKHVCVTGHAFYIIILNKYIKLLLWFLSFNLNFPVYDYVSLIYLAILLFFPTLIRLLLN